MTKLSYRTEEAVKHVNSVDISTECLQGAITFKEHCESLTPSTRTHYDKLDEWSDSVYGYVSKKLKKYKFINGGAAMGKEQTPEAGFWWCLYGLIDSACYSQYLEYEDVAIHHVSANARNNALIAELNDLIETLNVTV